VLWAAQLLSSVERSHWRVLCGDSLLVSALRLSVRAWQTNVCLHLRHAATTITRSTVRADAVSRSFYPMHCCLPSCAGNRNDSARLQQIVRSSSGVFHSPQGSCCSFAHNDRAGPGTRWSTASSLEEESRTTTPRPNAIVQVPSFNSLGVGGCPGQCHKAKLTEGEWAPRAQGITCWLLECDEVLRTADGRNASEIPVTACHWHCDCADWSTLRGRWQLLLRKNDDTLRI
jgi:hypothetical protein